MVIPNIKMTMYGISSKKRSIGGVLSYSCKICLLGETLPKGFENIKISNLTAGTLALPSLAAIHKVLKYST